MKTLITEFISLDGVVQAPGGPGEDTDGGFSHGGWSRKYFDPAVMGGTYAELAKHSDALLQGRRTYQVSAGAWPSRSGDPFSDWINRVQKYVVSDTLSEKDITWNPTTIIRGEDVVETVSLLRAPCPRYFCGNRQDLREHRQSPLRVSQFSDREHPPAGF